MSFLPDEDADELRTVIRGFLEKRSPEAEVRRLAETDTGYDPSVWRQVTTELGLAGLAVPERHGGSGATPIELGVAFEEMGRVLFCAPFLATVGLAATALVEIGDDVAAEKLSGIVSGSTLATLAWSGSTPDASTLRAHFDGRQWLISGAADIVIDGATADLVLVAAQSPAGPCLFSVVDPESLDRQPLTALDSTRKLAAIGFAETPAELLGQDGGAAETLARTHDLAALYLAAEQLGGAERLLRGAVDYAGVRIQFGRPIGSFQAIKHRCADMLVEVESARSAVWHGLWTATQHPDELAMAAALARSVASDVYQRVATDNIQIHGGIGFTWEHWAHLYLKRAKSSQLIFGSPSHHRARLTEFIAAEPQLAADPGESSPDLPDGAEAISLSESVDKFLVEHPVPESGDLLGDRRFREARYDAGLAVVSFAPGFGGRGLDVSLQGLVEERFGRAGALDHTARNVIGLGMALPTIHAHGTAEQKQRFLRPCYSGEEIWCQLFSEPGAGSDLAALSTRAVRDGDDFVVTGQKVWTSLGHVAQWGILLARTDPDVPKHKGLTYFLVDMRSPGVEVRPLRQLTGEAEFNEVYLHQVRIPASNVVGVVGGGWSVAMTTLANERESLGARPAARGSGPIGQAVDLYRRARARASVDPALTERLAALWCRTEAARLTNIRAAAQVGREPGPEGSIAKLQMAELNKAVYELCVDLSGSDGLLMDDYTETAPDFAAVHGGGDVRKAYLRSLANSIEGGTSEVLRNILGERVLGLPGEPRVDRDIPWTQVRRS
ncbi:acyl-CoA dehydrogenase [Mycolicibacterium sp.]|uniref:acyl-CoA dehydrogenase n=1 Tax=Mycolicibacterium sp. TaxID=2320850 RepID=UPI0035601BDD